MALRISLKQQEWNYDMRILQLITLSELGGAQSVVINLANSLCSDHEVIVAAGEGDGKLWDMLDARVIRHQCRYLQREISIVKDPLALMELQVLYHKYRPDVIHLHSSKAGLLGRLAFPSGKIVYTVHGFDSIRVAHRKLLPLEKFMQNFCHSIVAVSRYDYENLLSEGIRRNVSYVYNAIEKPVAPVAIPDQFKKYEKVVLSIARVAPPKRHDLFIELSRRMPQYGFIWIGNTEPMEDLPDNCHFIGNIPNAGSYCSLADVFCLPSDFEGLPMVILEAMSFGKPIVASDVGGISEIVINGRNGFCVENTPDLFLEKINHILSDSSCQECMGHESEEIFASMLTIDKMTDGYMKLYDRICKNKKS